MFSTTLVLMANDVPWSHFSPDGSVLIRGINFLLNGQNQLNDFFPVGSFEEVKVEGDGTKHEVQSATVPEPTTISLLAIGIAGVAAGVFKRPR